MLIMAVWIKLVTAETMNLGEALLHPLVEADVSTKVRFPTPYALVQTEPLVAVEKGLQWPCSTKVSASRPRTGR